MTDNDNEDCPHTAVAVSRALVQVEHYRRLWVAAQMQLAEAIAKAEAEPGYDGSPPEIIDVPHPDRQDKVTAQRNIREHPLDLMHAKGQITTLLFQAGDRLRCDLELAHVSPIRSAQLDSIYLHTGPKRQGRRAREGVKPEDAPPLFQKPFSAPTRVWRDMQPSKLDAIDRVNRALRAVEAAVGVRYELPAQRGRQEPALDPARGKDAVAVLLAVLRDRALVRDLEAMLKWGRQDNIRKKYLRPALEALADYYGYSVRARSGKIRSFRDVGPVDDDGPPAEPAEEVA